VNWKNSSNASRAAGWRRSTTNSRRAFALYCPPASDLNQARTFVRGESTVRYLNDLVARCYLVIYGRPRVRFWSLSRPFPVGVSRGLPPQSAHFLLATVVFFAGATIGFLASYFDPVSRLFLLPATCRRSPRGRNGGTPAIQRRIVRVLQLPVHPQRASAFRLRSRHHVRRRHVALFYNGWGSVHWGGVP
jgi:hypothetical protein